MRNNDKKFSKISPDVINFYASEADRLGYSSLESYLFELHAQYERRAKLQESVAIPRLRGSGRSVHNTALGDMVCGDSLEWLKRCDPGTIDLVVTSPPFSLVRKKAYGNFDEISYLQWFEPFAQEIKRCLRDTGSFVLDLGGAWVPGLPVKSIYNFKVLLLLVEDLGFYLAQDHYWWNPSRLPTPAQWVNVERTRVKDAVNTVWWFSKTPYPRASNKKVLQPYSDSMKKSLRMGYGVEGKIRPSGHKPSDAFSHDNGGSIPPNLLAIANTAPRDHYTQYCEANGLAIHPARFPSKLPEYFIRMCTKRGDLVVDPFAGSCVTGYVAESLGRRWVCIDTNEEYLKGAKGRFVAGTSVIKDERKVAKYEISPPTFKRYKA